MHVSVVVQGSPWDLVRREGSRLRAMSERTGDLEGLIGVAREAEEERLRRRTEEQAQQGGSS